MSIEEKIRILLIRLIINLTKKNYNKIVAEKQNGRLTEQEIERAIYEYSEYWEMNEINNYAPSK